MMTRLAFALTLLVLLAGSVPAAARPVSFSWPFWLRRPESHGSRKLAGDFTHARGSYRYHSRERHGLLAFLHPRPPGVTARHRHGAGRQPAHRSSPMTL